MGLCASKASTFRLSPHVLFCRINQTSKLYGTHTHKNSVLSLQIQVPIFLYLEEFFKQCMALLDSLTSEMAPVIPALQRWLGHTSETPAKKKAAATWVLQAFVGFQHPTTFLWCPG